jgi:ATP-binding cassette, subfamily B, bacterial HlyB/CyaB
MTPTTTSSIQTFLARTEPFDRLSPNALTQLVSQLQPLRYRMGQAIVLNDALPSQIAILYQGQARSIAQSDRGSIPDTLERLEPGAILGWISHRRQLACEVAIASTEAICLVIDIAQFDHLCDREPEFDQALQRQVHPAELYVLLQQEADRQAWGNVDLAVLAARLGPQSVALNWPQGKASLQQLDPTWTWLLSCGQVESSQSKSAPITIGAALNLANHSGPLRVKRPPG